MRVFALIVCVAMLSASIPADAKGRKGSTRVGGYTSHGKGSHYIGGMR